MGKREWKFVLHWQEIRIAERQLLFNSLTGSNQYVGNWPGVTVEKKEGKLKGNKDVIITGPARHLLAVTVYPGGSGEPGLSAEGKPDVIINMVDATNIERNLYLTTQVLELGIPVVIALNMIDLSRKNGDQINTGNRGAALAVKWWKPLL